MSSLDHSQGAIMHTNARIFVAGHNGLVGSAIVRELSRRGYENLLLRSHEELDLTDPAAVESFFAATQPEYIFLAAAKVGGIQANRAYPVDFITTNLAISLNIIKNSHKYDAKKLLFLGSSCIYPRLAPQPIKEEYLLTSALEPSNDAYALAKIAGIRMCRAYREQYGRDFISTMPTNLYGPGDNFHPQNSHVLPAMLRRFHEAKLANTPEVVLWGTGTPMREFLYVDDLAEACVFLMENYSGAEHINVGTGEDVTIKELAETIASVVGYEGKLIWNTDMPDGTPRKLLDVTKINELGWRHRTSLREGIEKMYAWYTTAEKIRQ